MDLKDVKCDYGLWQPELQIQPKLSFSISLNPEFAQESLSLRPTKESVGILFSIIKEQYEEELKYTPSNLYDLMDDSCYLKCIYLGGGGVWLDGDVRTLEMMPSNGKPIVYSCHNVDTVEQAILLQILFQNWARWVLYAGHDKE